MSGCGSYLDGLDLPDDLLRRLEAGGEPTPAEEELIDRLVAAVRKARERREAQTGVLIVPEDPTPPHLCP